MTDNFAHPGDHFLTQWLDAASTSYWIAGGACLSWYHNRPCESDVDLFFACEAEYLKMKNYMDRHPDKCTVRMQTKNAITYLVSDPRFNYEYDVQLIHRTFYETVDDLLDDFDISVCCIAWDGSRVWTGDAFARDVADRRLRIRHVNRNTNKRLIKYWVMGYQPTDEDIDRVLSAEDLNWKASGDEYAA